MLLDGAAVREVSQLAVDSLASTTDTATVPPADPDASTAPAPPDPPATEQPERAFALSDDPTNQIVVVDASVPFASDLLADIPPEWTVIRLQADSDGLTQLAQALADRNNVAAIHLFSHGGEGRIELGSTSLTPENLAQHAESLRLIGQRLSSTGDLMIYGCNVAGGFMGQQFVNDIARITGADVAASDDATGAVIAGGDWQLEQQTGEINTQSLSSATYINSLADYTINISQNASRLYYQASGLGEGPYWNNTDDTTWADAFTTPRTVPYWALEWRSFEYTVPRWGWVPWETRTAWYQWPVERSAQYGAGTRYGTQSVTLSHDSTYEFKVAAEEQYKSDIPGGQIQSLGAGSDVGLNVALYRNGFNPARPLEHLVAASQGVPFIFNTRWGAGNLYRNELAAGNYTVVVSFDGWKMFPDNNIVWSRGNSYAEQVWGKYKLTVTNLNRPPVWASADLSQTANGAGDKTLAIPLSSSGVPTISDPDGDEMAITATLTSGAALPTWLSFNPNSLSFSGNAPANTGTLAIRLTANDGQVTSTKDLNLTFTSDNDRPVVAAPIPDITWDGSGAFSATVPAGTFTDADPGADVFTYTATLADGSALPAWLTMNSSGTLSGNPPANFASLQIRVTANDGSGQSNATQTDEFNLTLVNNNDVPTVSNIAKTINEDASYSFSITDFGFTDTDTHASDGTTLGVGKSLQSIRIVSLPSLAWVSVSVNAKSVMLKL